MDIQGFIIDSWISRMSDKHPVLTVYDPEGKYTSLLPLAENKGITVINTTKTPFAAYEQAFDFYLNKLGIDREARMLIYRSKHIPATEGEKSDDPFYALSQIGECFPFGPNDDLLMISKRFLPNKTAEIDKLQAEGNLKFNSINALQGGASYPVLENLTHGKSPKEMTLGLLRLESVADLSWMQEWKQLAENHYPGLNADGNSLASVQENLWQYLLFSEFVLDLPTKLPDTMASIPMALPENKETIFDLCNSIRNHMDMREDYVCQANRISEKLHLADSFAKASNLGAVVTFAFENRVEYTSFNQAVSSGQYEQAAAMVAKNKQSIWYGTDDSVRQFWNLADHACQLFAVIYASKSIPADASFKDIAQWYASTGYKADNAFRHYMTIEQDISHVSPYINDLSKAVVDAYRSFTETEVQQYQQTVASEGLQGEIGIQRNTNAFSTHIAPLLAQGKKVVLVMADAFRFEIGMEMAEKASPYFEVSCVPSLCALPPVTRFGMAALLPNAEQKMTLKPVEDKLQPFFDGTLIATPSERIDYIANSTQAKVFDMASDTFEAANIPADTQLLVIRSTAIDTAGESSKRTDFGFSSMKTEINTIYRCIDECLKPERGFQQAFIMADHGFMMQPDYMHGDKIMPPLGNMVLSERRCVAGDINPAPNVMLLEPGHLGIQTDVFRFGFAESFGVFEKSCAYFHEGLSLQENIVPIVTLKRIEHEQSHFSASLAYKNKQSGTVRILNPSIQIEITTDELFSNELHVIMQVTDSKGKVMAKPIESLYYNETTGIVTIPADTLSIKQAIAIEEGFSGDFTVTLLDADTKLTLATLTLQTEFDF